MERRGHVKTLEVAAAGKIPPVGLQDAAKGEGPQGGLHHSRLLADGFGNLGDREPRGSDGSQWCYRQW